MIILQDTPNLIKHQIKKKYIVYLCSTFGFSLIKLIRYTIYMWLLIAGMEIRQKKSMDSDFNCFSLVEYFLITIYISHGLLFYWSQIKFFSMQASPQCSLCRQNFHPSHLESSIVLKENIHMIFFNRFLSSFFIYFDLHFTLMNRNMRQQKMILLFEGQCPRPVTWLILYYYYKILDSMAYSVRSPSPLILRLIQPLWLFKKRILKTISYEWVGSKRYSQWYSSNRCWCAWHWSRHLAVVLSGKFNIQ